MNDLYFREALSAFVLLFAWALSVAAGAYIAHLFWRR